MNKLELPVGGVFVYTKERVNPRVLHHVRVVEAPNGVKGYGNSCAGCIFEGGSMETCYHIACTLGERTDKKNVKFIEVEGGEE